MTKEEILNGMSEEEFYNLYPTEEAYFMAKGGSLSGAPHNGQPTADEFFSYGAPALGHMNIPMSNPTYLAHGGTPYYGGPIYPAQDGVQTQSYQNLDNEGRPIQGGLMWNPKTGETLKDPIIQPVSTFSAYGTQGEIMNPATQGTVGVNFNKVNTNNSKRSFGILGAKPGQMYDANTNQLIKQRFGGLPGGTNDNFIAPTNATKVATAPANYNTLGTQGTKTFYDKKADIAKTSPVGTTQPSAQWEQSIIDRVKSGSSPEELVKAGHISSAQAGKFKQYYKPVYTETQPTTPPVTKGVPLADENKIDRKEVFGQNPYKTYQYPDVNAGYSKATMRYFDPKSNQEIDLNKSFDPKGNYIPSYLSNPAAGAQGTVKETRYNTAIGSSTDNPNTVAMNSGFAYGGYMNMGGYNSPTNYGSFSVPMAEGGYYEPGGSNDLVDWAAKQQQMLQQRTNVGIPTNVKKYFGAFDEPRKFDSTHVYPGNPNIEMGFKGNKVMLISKDSDAENTVRRVNKPRTVVGPIVKGERDVYFDYLNPHEYGGVLDASNNQDYPVMDEGGRSNLMKIIKAAGKNMKKEYADGGNTTMQGGNQDYIANIKGTYDNFLKQNVYNSLVDQEQQDLSKAFMRMGGIPMAAGGWELSPEYRNSEKRSQVIKALENKKKIAINQNLSDDQLLDMARKEGIIVDTPDDQSQSTTLFQKLAKNFPANSGRGYSLSNKDYNKLYNMPEGTIASGLGLKYGSLARALGKTGRNLFGPKEIYMDFLNYNPSIHNKKPLEPFKGPYPEAGESPFTEGFPAMHTVKEKPVQRYGGLPMAQTGFSNPVDMTMNAIANYKPGPEYLPQKSATDMFAKQTEADLKTRLDNTQAVDTSSAYSKDRVSFKRDNSALGQYAVPGLNMLSGMIEAPGQKRREQQAKLKAMTPGSDTGPFAVKPANAMNRGDYDPNSGMFRPDDMVPVQFPGGMYGAYGGSFQDGGMFEEGEELDLSPEEIEELRNQGYEIEELD